MAKSTFPRQRCTHQAGFSLIELMISMVIGMVVVGAVMAAYLGAGRSSSSSRAMAQITEDASIAMNVMRASIAMVGYGTPTGIANNKFTKAYSGPGLFGCDAVFSKPSDDIGALACGTTGRDAIAVAYEADKDNSIVKGVQPLDCLGNPITQTPGTPAYYRAYNRFYVSNDQLMCYGSGSGTAAQPLVDNVADLQIRYGVAIQTSPNQVAAYKTADEIVPAYTASGWDRVVSVRICMVIKSADEVLDQKVPYEGCKETVEVKDIPDRRMYRTFTTTVVLQNRLGSMR